MRADLEKQTRHRYFLRIKNTNTAIICFKAARQSEDAYINLGCNMRDYRRRYLNVGHPEFGFSIRKIKMYA